MNKLLKLFNRSSLVIKFSVIAVLLIVIYMLFFKKYSLENFGNPTSCTYYYMENCGHCKRFSPEWDKFESSYEGPVQLRKLEMNEAGDDLQKYKIKGFPTVLFLDENGQSKEYDGPRTSDGLMQFLSNM